MSNLPSPVPGRVRDLLRTESVKKRFEEVLQHRSPQFIASLAQLIYNTPGMDECEPNSVFAAAMIAATLDLPIDKNLGQAWIIPYNDTKARCKKAQFQLGYKGYIQLALRTGQYKSINVSEVYESEITFNRFTGAISFHDRKSEQVVGYLGYIALLNGYEKYLYMSVADLYKHAEKFSKSYKNDTYGTSLWKTNFDGMARKTVIKALLTKWGILSVEMRQAVLAETTDDGHEPEKLPIPKTPEQLAAAREALFGKDGSSGELPRVDVGPDFDDASPSSPATDAASVDGDPAAAAAAATPPAHPPEPGRKPDDKLANGNTRPMEPEALKRMLLAKSASKPASSKASENQVKLLAYALGMCFPGDSDADKKRHTLQKFLTGSESLNAMPGPYQLALLDWLKPVKDSGGDYVPNAMAVKEANLALREALKASGQAELPL